MKKLPFILLIFLFSYTLGFSQKDRIDEIAVSQSWPKYFVGSVEDFSISSSYVDELYDISIYLPPSYHHTEKTYPLFITTDAFHTFGIAENTANLLIFGNEIPEIIIVGIGFKASNTVEYVKKRARDFTTSPVDGFSTFGGAEHFYDFISKELIPKIEKKYRTNPQDKALNGFSFGGQFTAHVLLEHTNDFKRYIMGSPSYWWDRNLIKLAQSKVDYIAKTNTRIYTFLGKKEVSVIGLWEEFNSVFEGVVTDKMKFKKSLVEGKSHTAVFPVEFPNALEWIYKEEE